MRGRKVTVCTGSHNLLVLFVHFCCFPHVSFARLPVSTFPSSFFFSCFIGRVRRAAPQSPGGLWLIHARGAQPRPPVPPPSQLLTLPLIDETAMQGAEARCRLAYWSTYCKGAYRKGRDNGPFTLGLFPPSNSCPPLPQPGIGQEPTATVLTAPRQWHLPCAALLPPLPPSLSPPPPPRRSPRTGRWGPVG